MIKIFKVENSKIDLVDELDEITSIEGVESYFESLGYGRSDIEKFIGRGYWEGNYDKFVVNLKDFIIIGEE